MLGFGFSIFLKGASARVSFISNALGHWNDIGIQTSPDSNHMIGLSIRLYRIWKPCGICFDPPPLGCNSCMGCRSTLGWPPRRRDRFCSTERWRESVPPGIMRRLHVRMISNLTTQLSTLLEVLGSSFRRWKWRAKAGYSCIASYFFF